MILACCVLHSGELPYSVRVLLESAVRNCDNFQVLEKDVRGILRWKQLKGTPTSDDELEIPFKPARVILQDFTGVPAVVDFAAMRDAVLKLGGDPDRINPICPSDLVIDHSVQVDFARSEDALAKNQDLEFERNKERFTFLKWRAKAFNNMLGWKTKTRQTKPNTQIPPILPSQFVLVTADEGI